MDLFYQTLLTQQQYNKMRQDKIKVNTDIWMPNNIITLRENYYQAIVMRLKDLPQCNLATSDNVLQQGRFKHE